MSESNATQVILTDDGIKIIKAQNTADNVAGGVANLNDPNLMSVIEKQNNIGQFAGLTSQYNVIVQDAKNDGIDTTAVTTAYNDLNKFMADILKDPSHASDVDRAAYKKYQDAYNEELAKIQSALQNNANNKFTSAASATSQAASTASQAFIQAQSAVDYANSAIENDKVTSQAVTDLKGGSKLTIQQLQDGMATKVESSDFKSYKEQTADMFVSKVSFNNLTISNRNLALGTATPITFVGQNVSNQSKVGYQFSSVIPDGTLVTVTFDITSSTGVGTYTMQFDGNDTGGSWQTITTGSLVNGTKHVSVTIKTIGNNLHAWQKLDNATGTVTISNFIISKSSKEVSWTPAPEDTQSQFTQLADKINLRVTKDGLISQINLQAKNTLISSGGQLTLSGKNIYFDTDNPVMIPSANIETVLVNKKLEAADISANTFSTNNETFTVDKYGAITANNMTLIGGTLTSPTINASTINGSTINGTTFNAGDIISSTYNTSQFYPTTITPDGLVATTGFNSMDGLRTEMSAGSFVTKYRAVNSSSNQYEAYDGVFSGDELALNSGFTNGIDMGFQQSVSGNQLTGQVVLSPLNGIHLWGSTQSIHFSGIQMNGTGITMNSYGNILADQASTWWRVTSFSGHDIANFGTDTAGSNVIQFNRELDIGNFHINTGHTFTSADNGDIHFAKGRGGAANIYAGAVNYTSLVKSSLLSVKKDVKKADAAYWAQLVNSIDLATYQYKTDDNTSHLRLSSIVDDVNVTKQWQLPDVFISRDENGKLNGVDDSVLLNATLATVQEQQKEIDQLNGHNMELEARLNKLEAKLNG
ncbi:phage tail protein [Lactiplantibacillus plantarum]|uniref:phage tail protein n=1 Tax=Lactiplantibacillus plantarum TaxID=1590 RepID=UPI000D21DAF7|nr:phage tail protein [Lactiplantibacillus plantarum]AVW04557.1 phage tail protein [Lactiplantibacillus plantarum]